MTNISKIRIFIVDDSVVMRRLLREFLSSDAEIEVIGEAANGRDAVKQILELKPDLVTMDLEMPIMGGHEAIEKIMAVYAIPILVISAFNDAQNAYNAISRGALEVIGKPQLNQFSLQQFATKVKMLSKIKVIKHLRPVTSISKQNQDNTAVSQVTNRLEQPQNKNIFAIASSTGGPQALEIILQQLPADFPAPIVISQHISSGFEQGMVNWLNGKVPLSIKIAQDSELLIPGRVYIAPSENPMSVTANRRITLCHPRAGDVYRPSCNVLLESVANHYTKEAVGIICTGMGSDGVTGMELIHNRGGVTIAQDEATSVIFGMNQVAISKGCIDHVLPLPEIAEAMLMLSGYRKNVEL